ncbi:phage tail tape measure protein [Vibrio sp. bablab_jr001]|uniref:phage tail tape measure protein n=1 Tax=Vibrio sp. bablab_jr001 TaxID=2755067 RepID=UPI0018F1E259|nr:phage tail tape measure protein [Vibrio sp. bablab_jr001]
MADNKASVGIGIEARVDRSVSRAFDDLERQNQRLGKSNQRLKNETTKLGRENQRTGRAVTRTGNGFINAGKKVRKYTQDIGAAIKKSDLMRRSVEKMDEGLDSIGNKWTALATGAAGTGSAVAVMGLEERYERLGIQAGKTKDEMATLRAEMFATSQQADVRVDQSEMLSAVEKIVEKTGNLKFAQENMANIGRVMQATGAAGIDVGEMFADMSQKFGLKNSEDVLSAIDTLVVQGKAGAFTLQNLAAEGASVSAAYAAMGRTGPKAVQEMGAMLQISRMGSGSAAEAASAMESVLADITSNYEDIEKLGIEVFDEEALARGEKKFRDLPSIVKEIMEATNSDITEYSQLFGDEAMRFMKVLSSEDGKASFDSFLSISGDGTAVLQDSARAAQTANAAMMTLKTAWMSFADEKLAEPIADLADAINSIEPENLNKALTGATALAGTLGAVWAGRKAYKMGKSVVDFVRGPKGGGAGVPGLPSGEVSNVYVTNMPSGGFGGGMEGGRTRKRGKPRTRSMPGRTLGKLGGLTRKLPYIGAALGALDIGSTLMNDSLSSKEKSQQVGGTVGSMGGAMAGASLGAAMGSFVPVIGTAIGGIAGALIGGMGGDSLGSWIGGLFGSDRSKPGDAVKKGNAQSALQLTQTANSTARTLNSSSNSNAPAQINFNPVFHVQGNASDDQIDKLEKMVVRVAKQMEKLNVGGRNVRFADS